MPTNTLPNSETSENRNSNSKVQLLHPVIQRQLITKDQYKTLSPTVQMLAANYPHIWKVTITPQKTPESGLCRVNIIAAANMREDKLMLENGGRVPTTVPADNLDDLRPVVHYYFGIGSQTIKIVLSGNPNHYMQDTIKFVE